MGVRDDSEQGYHGDAGMMQGDTTLVDTPSINCSADRTVSITDTRVNLNEFCSLAISPSRRLIRVNDPAAGLCGLLDPETGERFLIAERELQMFGH